MNKAIKIPFHGKEMVAVKKEGKVLVAMKPIVEALGLEWNKQLEMIKRDPVLNSTMAVTAIVASDGKNRNMICLPIEYLNGWLFKIPASRYTGKKKESIMLYQKECYQALYDYWHNGGAVNPRISEEQAVEAVDKIAKAGEGRFDETMVELLKNICNQLERAKKTIDAVSHRCNYLENFHPKGMPYELSRITGRTKDRFVSGYYSSNRKARLLAALALMPELPWGDDYGY